PISYSNPSAPPDPYTLSLHDALPIYILAYADEIQQVDTTGIEPTSHALRSGLNWRSDIPVPSLDRQEVLAAAPEGSPSTGLFKRSEEHTSELQSLTNLVCRLLLEKKN